MGANARQASGREDPEHRLLPTRGFSAALHFSWKYADDFSLAILSNAKVGGDNCHRGVVVGSIVGMHTGVPPKWLRDLKAMEFLPSDIASGLSHID